MSTPTNARVGKTCRLAARLIAEQPDLMDHLPLAIVAVAGDYPAAQVVLGMLDSKLVLPQRTARDTVYDLHEAAHRLAPVRLPIGLLTINPARHSPYALGHLFMVTSSAGKDSVVMEDVVCTQAEQAGVLDRVVVVHNDLGETGSGEPVEWPGTADLARRQAQRYGVRFEITRREKGGLFQQLTRERKKFPSSAARWCTSDQKTSQGMKRATAHVDEIRRGGDVEHVIVYYCVGLRAAESPARARKAEFTIDRSASNSRRTVIRWHPILDWSARQVWQHIKDRGLEYHWAYDAGMDRLSCRLCVLATKSDLVCAARLSPKLVDDYVAAETDMGHTFQQGLSIADIAREAAAAERENGLLIEQVVPGAALERHLADDIAEAPEQLTLCTA